jgi:ribonuclease HI
MRLLGLHFDSNFDFSEHVKILSSKCNSTLFWLEGMKRTVPAEKLKMLVEGLILSRISFAADAYYPFISRQDREILERIHYRASRIITGTMKSVHGVSIMAEAGFKPLSFMMEEVVFRVANSLAHWDPYIFDSHPKTTRSPMVGWGMQFGMRWVIHLFQNLPMSTASLRPKISSDGTKTTSTPYSIFPPKVTVREEITKRGALIQSAIHKSADYIYDGKRVNSKEADLLSVRDAWMLKLINNNNNIPRMMRTVFHPYDPRQLKFFDRVKFLSTAPGGLKKPEGHPKQWPKEVLRKLVEANEERMTEIKNSTSDNAINIFTDASRNEVTPSCAGAWIMFRGWNHREGEPFNKGHVAAGPHACSYSGETLAILAALEFCCANSRRILEMSKFMNIIVDAQSAMLACEKTWIRPMNFVEQQISWRLFLLARYGFEITVGFVFSHLGVAGNNKVDKEAEEARKSVGHNHPKLGYQQYDTKKFYSKYLNFKYLKYLQRECCQHFRFDIMNQNKFFNGNSLSNIMSKIMSPHLPRTTMIQREDEIRLYYARIGMFPEIGGYYQQEQKEKCPLCGVGEAIGRNGLTIQHLFGSCSDLEEIRKDKYGKKINLFLLLWENPIFSVFVLRYIFYSFSFELEKLNNNNLQRSKNKQKFLPFIFSLLKTENQKNSRTKQKSLDLHASMIASLEAFVRCTFLF